MPGIVDNVPARVLWLTKGLGLGGAERLLTLVAPKIDRTRFEVDVAYLLPWKDAFVHDLEKAGIEPVCLGARRTVDFRWVRRLRRLMSKRRYDVVHTHSPVPAAAARILAGRETTLVHTEHNVWERYRWPTYAVNAATFRRNAAVISVSKGVASSIVLPWWTGRKPLPPVEVLYHGIDVEAVRGGPEARAHARSILGLSPNAPVIGTVANFTAKKNHAGLLEAVDLLRQDHEDIVAVLIGSGPLEPKLRADVSRRGLDGHVQFLGSRDDVPQLLPALDVFVLGSRFEGLAISLLEAMAAGIPCVATRVGGIPEAVIDGEQGDLVPSDDPEALAKAIRAQLQDEPRRLQLGAAGIRHVRENFSIDGATRRIEAIYDTVLA